MMSVEAFPLNESMTAVMSMFNDTTIPVLILDDLTTPGISILDNLTTPGISISDDLISSEVPIFNGSITTSEMLTTLFTDPTTTTGTPIDPINSFFHMHFELWVLTAWFIFWFMVIFGRCLYVEVSPWCNPKEPKKEPKKEEPKKVDEKKVEVQDVRITDQ